MKNIKKSLLMKMLCLPLIISLTGCVYLFVGGVGALGGYAISSDTVEGLTDTDEMSVWDSTIEIISIMGLIERQDEQAGEIRARVTGANVTIHILGLNDSTTKVRVKARKSFLPRPKIAQDVFVKIMSNL